MEPQELRPQQSASPEQRSAPRMQRPDRPDSAGPPPPPSQQPPADVPPAGGPPKPRIDRRTLLAAGALALAALVAPKLFHSGPQPLPPPSGQNFDPQYRATTLALQAAPKEPMPASLGS